MTTSSRPGLRQALVRLLGIVLLAVLAASYAQTPRHGGTLTVAYSTDPVTMDTMVNISPPREVRSLVFEPLVDFDASFTPRPTLAASWETSADGLTWTFYLREDVVFHDGAPMTSADVVASFERLKRVGQRATEFRVVQSAEAVDDYTVNFNLSEPWAAFTESLSMPGGGLTVYPAWVVEKWGDNTLTSDFIGTGPYRVVEIITGERYVFERFEDYVSPPGEPSHLAGARHAYADRIVVLPIPDPSTRVAALMTGEIDLATSIPGDDLARMNADPNVNTFVSMPGYRLYMKLNTVQGPFTDPLLRYAVRAAIDSEAVMATQGPADLWRVNNTPRFQEGMWMWHDNVAPYFQNDMELARYLVQASDYDGETIRFMASPGRAHEYRTFIIVEEALRDIGLNIEVVTVDSATFNQRRADNGAWEAKVAGGTPTSPVSYLNSSAVDRRGARWPWVTAEWDYYFAETQRNPDLEARSDALWHLYRLHTEGAGELWFGDVFWFNAARANVHGVPTDGGDMLWLPNVWKE